MIGCRLSTSMGERRRSDLLQGTLDMLVLQTLRWGPALAREATRSVWAWTALEQLAADLQIGARILWRAPALSATAVVLIALVIGGNTTIYSMVHSILA